jgi:hypothetical protein
LLLVWALPWVSWGQEFTPIYENLDRLGSIMKNWQTSLEEQRSDNESLKSALHTLDELLREQGRLLNEAAHEQSQREAIEKRQAALLLRYTARSRNLRIGLLIGIPAAAGAGLLAGWLMSR